MVYLSIYSRYRCSFIPVDIPTDDLRCTPSFRNYALPGIFNMLSNSDKQVQDIAIQQILELAEHGLFCSPVVIADILMPLQKISAEQFWKPTCYLWLVERWRVLVYT